MPSFAARLRHAFSSDDDRESERLRTNAVAAGATPIASVRPHEAVAVHGRVTAVTLVPVRGTRWFQAELSDGSGTLLLIWMGRRTVAGIAAGVVLTVWGRTCADHDRLVMYNPRYEVS